MLIKDWSYDKKVLPLIRRKHDLVFLSIEEFPPKFWIIETKMQYANPEDPFNLFGEASERVSLWNRFGLRNVVPYYIQPAPYVLQNHSLLHAYCAVISYFKQLDDKQVYDDFWLRDQDEQEIWGILSDDQ